MKCSGDVDLSDILDIGTKNLRLKVSTVILKSSDRFLVYNVLITLLLLKMAAIRPGA